MTQFEETITRLEQERTELLATIEKGEGFDAAIQQIQQDNVNNIFFLERHIKFSFFSLFTGPVAGRTWSFEIYYIFHGKSTQS